MGREERNRNIILALDPSGNFTEGKGTTGWCVANGDFIFAAGQIYAAEFSTQEEYWDAVIDLIKHNFEKYQDGLTVVCEDYRLYASASEAQINSNLETPQLIGAIKYVCWLNRIPIVMQMAAEVKNRWSNEVLINSGKLLREGNKYRMGNIYLNNHSLDAVRHCLHYAKFKMNVSEKPIRHRSYSTSTRRFYDYD